MRNEVTVPAGKYYLGDPCYLIPDADWLAWLEAADYRNAEAFVAKVPYTDLVAVAFSTAYGDGSYPLDTPDGTDGGYIPVDSGLIGVVPFDAITSPLSFDGSYKIVNFDNDTVVTEEIGIMDFGGYIVNTDPNADEDDDYDEELNDEEDY